jgi:hypothetical protein
MLIAGYQAIKTSKNSKRKRLTNREIRIDAMHKQGTNYMEIYRLGARRTLGMIEQLTITNCEKL